MWGRMSRMGFNPMAGGRPEGTMRVVYGLFLVYTEGRRVNVGQTPINVDLTLTAYGTGS